ncbi:hypothetical protein NA57DRAFT_76415 [Rhizodiscina lignyota]|uniref:Glycoside hydrolase family 5 protein n=1 Tax=Rhizodiscina lignyota TaxID=1504668 RepID=A0A9P4ICS9_9PEZI|nr:hypothetical protein NA57DRAFT_76415 [Rhizodiscina lignyota]
MRSFTISSFALSLACLTSSAQAVFSSFGGVNHYFLPFLPAGKRDAIITSIYQGGSKSIRTIVRPITSNSEKDSNDLILHDDPQHGLGEGDFDLSLLDIYDDFLSSVNRISNGNMKVIFALHDANNIRGYNDLPCDTFCQATTNGDQSSDAWQNFYTDSNLVNAYKLRLSQFLNVYKSKNFNGASWSTLSQVILGVDLQNEPWVNQYPIPSGQETWICDISSYLKNDLGLGSSNIAVFSGGLSGGAGPLGFGNAPDAALNCADLDVIALHAYLSSSNENVDQQWYDLLVEGGDFRNAITSHTKLLFVEEWSYLPGNPSYTKQSDIWAQGHSLNVRGVPWTYWDVMSGDENCPACESKEVSVDGGAGSSWDSLQTVLKEASSAATDFDWSKYIAMNSGATQLRKRGGERVHSREWVE